MKLVFHTYILCISLKTITFVAPIILANILLNSKIKDKHQNPTL